MEWKFTWMMKKNGHFWRYRMRFNQVTIVVFKIFFIQFYLCNSNSDEIRWVFFTSISIDFHFDKNHWLEFVNGYDLIGYKVCSLFELCIIIFLIICLNFYSYSDEILIFFTNSMYFIQSILNALFNKTIF